MPYTKEEFAEAMRQPGSLATAPYPLGSKRLERQTIWKEGEPLPEPKTIPDNPEHDASRNDYIRLVTENNLLVRELQKLRAAVPESSAEPVLKDEAIKTLVSHATDTGPLGQFARKTIFQDGMPRPEVIRAFDTGATRSSDAGRYDPERYIERVHGT